MGKDIIEMADALVGPSGSELLISKRGGHATVKSKSTIEMVDTFTRTADTKWIEGKNSAGMQGMEAKQVKHGSMSELQGGSSGGSPSSTPAANLDASSIAKALGDLTKQHFYGAGHAQC